MHSPRRSFEPNEDAAGHVLQQTFGAVDLEPVGVMELPPDDCAGRVFQDHGALVFHEFLGDPRFHADVQDVEPWNSCYLLVVQLEEPL